MIDGNSNVSSLIATMTLRQKLAQLVGLWAKVRRSDDAMAPMQERMLRDGVVLREFAAHGLGQLTRHYGTRPEDPRVGRADLDDQQAWLASSTPHGIHALVHEECLTGVLAWGATVYPTPLAWGASFDPDLVEAMARRIGTDLRALGVHQGLAPVLDVVRDARWGRVEECISEDPVLVGSIGTAYVRGLEAEGRVATLKHFVGYSASRAGRNHAPVGIGQRELREVFLPPFEQAIRDGGARSVMNSYTELDGIPVAAHESLLTGILREEWGFAGTVVADYFAVTFLATMHGVAADDGAAAVAALTAGIDVELPTGAAFLEPLAAAVERGEVAESLVDRALERVLRQKAELGLLDAPEAAPADPIDLDSPANRAIASRLAEESIVLLTNDGLLPLDPTTVGRIAVVGPNAANVRRLLGCYSFDNHVLPHHPVDSPPRGDTALEAIRREWPMASVHFAVGCEVMSDDAEGIPEAAALVAQSDVAIVVVGDVSGMFGRGTSGEGCDVVDLGLPGRQTELIDACLATGTPVIVVLATGRPYALDAIVGRASAIVQAFLPGQEGAAAIAGVLSGRVEPTGRLPVQLPRRATPQPGSYMAPILGGDTAVSSADPTALFPFGFGLGYTRFEHGPLALAETVVPVDGELALEFDVTNVGSRSGTEVVQVYASDPVASVTRPRRWLVAFGRVDLVAGATARVRVTLATATVSLIDRELARVVEPGQISLTVARDAAERGQSVEVTLVGSPVVVPWVGADARVVRVVDDPFARPV